MTGMGKPMHIVLVGGGHAHLEVMRHFALRKHSLPSLQLTLVSPETLHIYSGMVPGFICGIYELPEISFDLEVLIARAGGRLIRQAALKIEPSARRLQLSDGCTLVYDALSFNIGSQLKGSDLEGVSEYALLVKPLVRVPAVRDALLALASRTDAEPVRVAVVGGGAAGVEMVHAVAALLDAQQKRRKIFLIDREPEILKGYRSNFRKKAMTGLRAKQIELLLSRQVRRVSPDRIGFSDGSELTNDALIWLTGPRGHSIFRNSGLATDAQGFLMVDDSLRAVSDPTLFGAGDCVTLAKYPDTPKAGVYAVRHGPVLIQSLEALLEGGAFPHYTPQKGFLSILNTCDGRALLSYKKFAFHNRLAWLLKDWIDRRFARRYHAAG